MTTYYREDLDDMVHNGEDQPIFVVPTCHRQAKLVVMYDECRGRLIFYCGGCQEAIGSVMVANSPDVEEKPRLDKARVHSAPGNALCGK